MMKTLLLILTAAFVALGFSARADLLITMVVDGDISSEPRFVEIYNNGTSTVDLDDFRIALLLNGSATGSASNLSGMLAPGDFAYLIANTGGDQALFQAIYGNTHMIVGAAQVNGTGNDVYELRDDPFTSVVDRFGVAGTNGTGQNWEYTDGAFVRLSSNTTPNPDFTGVGAGAGAPGVGLTGWAFTDLDGVDQANFAATLPVGTFSPIAIPEPATLGFFGLGALILGFVRRRR